MLTRSFRPSRSRSLKSRMASAASASLENSTNAKPRGWPVSRSLGRWTPTTLPAADRNCVSCCAVVWKLRLPTKILGGMAASSLVLWRTDQVRCDRASRGAWSWPTIH
jgi:hypothetical protein